MNEITFKISRDQINFSTIYSLRVSDMDMNSPEVVRQFMSRVARDVAERYIENQGIDIILKEIDTTEFTKTINEMIGEHLREVIDKRNKDNHIKLRR